MAGVKTLKDRGFNVPVHSYPPDPKPNGDNDAVSQTYLATKLFFPIKYFVGLEFQGTRFGLRLDIFG